MTLVADQDEAKRMLKLVQEALDRHQPAGYRIEVLPDAVMRQDDWYQVIVKSDQDVRSYDFYNVLAETEAELQDTQSIQVLLVPAVGD